MPVVDGPLTTAPDSGELEARLEQHRGELTGYCYRMLGSPFEAEDAVQETFIRAWRGFDRFEGRVGAALLALPDRDQRLSRHDREQEAARAADGPRPRARAARPDRLKRCPSVVDRADARRLVVPEDADPAEVAVARETIRLAFVAALQHLPPRQRAVLILCEVLRWKAAEVAELLETSVASVNSALQRARATLESAEVSPEVSAEVEEPDAELLARYVEAFERYDMEALTSLIHEDAHQSMPPYELWLRGRDDILAWWVGPGAGCRGSRVIPTVAANGAPAFGQYKPNEAGDGYEPWALQVLEIVDGRIEGFTFFLDTETGLPALRPAARLRSGVALIRAARRRARGTRAGRAGRAMRSAGARDRNGAARRVACGPARRR